MAGSCLIMMTSYNGEKYISEQIASIIAQDYQNWELIIQDDGSIDNTVDIINQYVKKDTRIQLWNNEEKRGAYCNFHCLINKCKALPDYDFYLFADHDDIWFPYKLTKMIEYYDKSNKENCPMLLYGDMEIINNRGNVISDSMNKTLGIAYVNPASTFFSHNVFGCNIMFNKELFRLVPEVNPDENITSIISHDNYYTKIAAIKGKVIFLTIPLMQYRRYGSNVTAEKSYSFGMKRIITRVANIEKLSRDHAATYNQSLFTINKIKEIPLSAGERNMITDIESAIKKGGVAGVSFYLKAKVSGGKKIKTFSRTVILLSGIYKKYII